MRLEVVFLVGGILVAVLGILCLSGRADLGTIFDALRDVTGTKSFLSEHAAKDFARFFAALLLVIGVSFILVFFFH